MIVQLYDIVVVFALNFHLYKVFLLNCSQALASFRYLNQVSMWVRPILHVCWRWHLWFCCAKCTAQKMMFSIKDFLSKSDQIRWKLRIWSHLLKKSLMENFIFCAVKIDFVMLNLIPRLQCKGVRISFKVTFEAMQQHFSSSYCTTVQLTH